MSKQFTGYITKYAMSGGVKKQELETLNTDSGYARTSRASMDFLKVGRDVFESLGDARADFEKRKSKRLASLKKQVAKIEKLNFPEGI